MAARDKKGRFVKGSSGGPGRPRGRIASSRISDDDLRTIVSEASDPFLVAMALSSSPEWNDEVRGGFPKRVADRVDRIIALAKVADRVLLKRLERELAAD